MRELLNIYQYACERLDENVAAFQEKFQAHMQCRKGCSACCENALFRIRLIEAQALWNAYQQAPGDVRASIKKNITQPEAGHEQDCPSLINGSCGLYGSRPALCRAYGTLVNLNGDVSTCRLNFNGVTPSTSLETIDIEPTYTLFDELSNRIWQQSPLSGESTEAPIFTIREFFESKLQDGSAF